MIKLSTPVKAATLPVQIGLGNKTMVLGSCFADAMGEKLRVGGFDVMVNPFGTLYNPSSVLSAILRMDSGKAFESADCVPMGAGDGRICSFEHHSSFARDNENDFLDNANAALERARLFWAECDRVIITFGTSWIWIPADASRRARLPEEAVSNCLKRPGTEFSRRMLAPEETAAITNRILNLGSGKQFIFTVSPIRHLGDGAHANTLSKAALQLGLDTALHDQAAHCYFPAYEIVLDELRDYRFFAEDLAHPSPVAANIIWERFRECTTLPSEQVEIDVNEKMFRSTMHISIAERRR